MTVIGMGYIDNSDSVPNNLRRGDVNFQNDASCTYLVNTYFGAVHDDNKNICVLTKEGTNACSGDSGGPLTCKNKQGYRQAGFVSYGTSWGCAVPDQPTVFIELAGYAEFIEEKSGLLRDINRVKDYVDFVEDIGTIDDNIDHGKVEDVISDELPEYDSSNSSGGSLGIFSYLFIFIGTILRRRLNKKQFRT